MKTIRENVNGLFLAILEASPFGLKAVDIVAVIALLQVRFQPFPSNVFDASKTFRVTSLRAYHETCVE